MKTKQREEGQRGEEDRGGQMSHRDAQRGMEKDEDAR